MNPNPNNNLHPPLPTQPCPSWEVIDLSLQTGGWPAYLCALRIVFDMCQSLTAQMSQLQQQTAAGPWTLPGAIPETGVIHAPSVGIDRLSGEES